MKLLRILSGVMLGLILLAGCGVSAAQLDTPDTTSATGAQAAALPNGRTELLGSLETTLEDLYARVNPAVVHIAVTQSTTQATAGGLPQELQQFGFQIPGLEGGQQLPQQQSQSLGSGFVWDTAGHIVTNHHVIANASTINVTFSDGATYPATVVGSDDNSDLAVLKIDAPEDKLQPISMGDSTSIKVGQLAVAIGNPFGLDNTMTVGFISALGRTLPVESASTAGGSYTIPDIIQTDAPINPGNSGGVLLNASGEVIGVTSAIESPVRASVGIGFAIPANVVQKVVTALISSGHYEHPWLGMSGTTLTTQLAQAMDLPDDQQGVLVVEVQSNSPADKAELHGSDREATIEGQQVPVGGDVITAINDTPIKRFEDLTSYLAQQTQVGDTLKLTILRDGQSIVTDVTLAARPTQK